MGLPLAKAQQVLLSAVSVSQHQHTCRLLCPQFTNPDTNCEAPSLELKVRLLSCYLTALWKQEHPGQFYTFLSFTVHLNKGGFLIVPCPLAADLTFRFLYFLIAFLFPWICFFSSLDLFIFFPEFVYFLPWICFLSSLDLFLFFLGFVSSPGYIPFPPYDCYFAFYFADAASAFGKIINICHTKIVTYGWNILSIFLFSSASMSLLILTYVRPLCWGLTHNLFVF